MCSEVNAQRQSAAPCAVWYARESAGSVNTGTRHAHVRDVQREVEGRTRATRKHAAVQETVENGGEREIPPGGQVYPCVVKRRGAGQSSSNKI